MSTWPVEELMEELPAGFKLNAPCSSEAVVNLESAANVRLPPDYVEFLLAANGGEGVMGDGSYLMLWRLQELLEFNDAYEVGVNAPGMFLIGSNGAGEASGFDLRSEEMLVVSVPFVGMRWELATEQASSFGEFLRRFAVREGCSALARRDGAMAEMEIFEIKPVILGGNPTDPSNKVTLTRGQHIDAVRYWNNLIRKMRDADT